MDGGSPDDIGAGLDGVLLRKSKHLRRFSASRGGAGKLDGRSSEAKYLRLARQQLIDHVGGHPTVVQAAIIDRLAWLALHLAKIDARTVERGPMSDIARREYLAWANAYSRLMARLGLERSVATHPGPTLAEVIAAGRRDG